MADQPLQESEREVRRSVAYMMDHGQSPEAEAARTLQRFMCCKAGRDLVEYGLLQPFGYTFEAGRVVSVNRNLRDYLETFEIDIACHAQALHEDPEKATSIADALGMLSQRMRDVLKLTEPC